MDQEQVERFLQLRYQHYVAGRLSLMNGLFSAAGISFGYAIELSLKALISAKQIPNINMNSHEIIKYYSVCVENGLFDGSISSDDFVRFIESRLHTRYPSQIKKSFDDSSSRDEAWVFKIDMLHCYDDLFLAIDDVNSKASSCKPTTAFAVENLNVASGRIFFHCNDHAMSRLRDPSFFDVLTARPDLDPDIKRLLAPADQIWRYHGVPSFRPWGPKDNWFPARTYSNTKFSSKMEFKAATWQLTPGYEGMVISSADLTLGAGKYQVEISEVRIPSPK